MNGDLPACFEPLIERSSQHEVLWGADGLPGVRGTLHGHAYRFSFSALPDGHEAWDEEQRVNWHFVMDFPFGFDVRVRVKGERPEKKKKGKKPSERPKTGITGFDDNFDAKAEDADIGRALPWLRDGVFQQVLYELCKGLHEVRLGPDSLHVTGPPRKGSTEEAAEAVRAGSWPDAGTIERLASGAQRLKSCMKRLGPKDATKDPPSGVHSLSPAIPSAPVPPPASPAPPEVIFTPGVPGQPAAAARADGPPEIVFIGDPAAPRSGKPAPSDVVMIGFDAEPPQAPRLPYLRRPGHRAEPPDPSARPPFAIGTGEERRPLLAWGSTWHIERLLQFQGLRRRCPELALQLDKDGYPDVIGVIEGIPFTLRVRWAGGKKSLAQATDFSLALEMACKPGFEGAVYRESWTLQFKTLFGSLQEVTAGKKELDEKYFFAFSTGPQGRFLDLVLDAETEPYLDALTDLCGVVRFVHDHMETEVTDKVVPRGKSQYDPFGEGLWPPGHFVDRLVEAARGLAERVNGLDTGLIFRRMRF